MKANTNKLGPYLLAAIITIAAILRVVVMFEYGDFWWDELFSITYSQKPWLASLQFWSWETNPPLHLLLLKLWFIFVPVSEWTARLPSLIFGVMNIWWIYQLGKKMFTPRVGLIAATILSLTSYHLFMSATARTYTLMLLLATISYYYFYAIFIKANTSRRTTFWYLTANTLLVYTHLTALFVLITQLISLIILHRRAIVNWTKLNLIPLILWLPWLIPSILSKLHNDNIINHSWFFLMEDSWQDRLSAFQCLFFGPSREWHTILVMIFVIFLMMFTTRQAIRKKSLDPGLVLVLLAFIIPIVTVCALKLWNIKFFLVALPGLVVFIAYYLSKWRTWLALLAIIALTVPGIIQTFHLTPISNWKIFNTYVADHYRADIRQIVIANDFIDTLALQRYFLTPVPFIVYNHYENIDWDRAVITKNYYRALRADADLESWYTRKNINSFQEIFLLEEENYGVDLAKIFEKHGWKLKDQLRNFHAADSRNFKYYVHN